MQIQHQAEATQGCFRIQDPAHQLLARLDYLWQSAEYFEITHTWVDPAYRGAKLAQQLIQAAVEFATTQQVKILPSCSYAALVMQRNPSFKALIYTSTAAKP